MEVRLNNIRGIDDAMATLYLSKGNYTFEKDSDIRDLVSRNTCGNGFFNVSVEDEFDDMFSKVIRIGIKHTTILRYIDFSFSVIGLHRGAQDDLDAHAHRFNNRIIRQSTRLSTAGATSKSQYYENKILTLTEVCELLNVELPDVVETKGDKYIKATNGYINANYIDGHPEEKQDVQRGLYQLALPSNCLVKCDLFEFSHVYKMRNKGTKAHPELRNAIESLTDQLAVAFNMSKIDFRIILNEIVN